MGDYNLNEKINEKIKEVKYDYYYNEYIQQNKNNGDDLLTLTNKAMEYVIEKLRMGETDTRQKRNPSMKGRTKMENQACGECIHENACQMWNIGTLYNTNAISCANYETLKQSNAYYIGFCEGKKAVK